MNLDPGWPIILYIMLAPALIALVISAIGTGMVRKFLHNRAVMDMPNQRSNHAVPTPRGGGIAMLAAIAASWLLIPFIIPSISRQPDMPLMPYMLAITIGLAIISWFDDLKGLHAGLRFSAQALAVAGGMTLLPNLPLADLLPAYVVIPLVFVGWLWFVNLYNFMDGIDGITGIETLSIAIGLWVMTLSTPLEDAALGYISAIGAAAVGFLLWNWAPAKIFSGDIGSISLGFLLGFFLIWAAGHNLLAPAALLPAYYVCDASITLFKRILSGQKFWQAHSQHAYQKAVRGGYSHAEVSLRLGGWNFCLITLSFMTLNSVIPWYAAIGFGYGGSLLLMLHLARGKR